MPQNLGDHEVADWTNPAHLRAHGLKLKGRKVVTDDGDETEIDELNEEQAKKLAIA